MFQWYSQSCSYVHLEMIVTLANAVYFRSLSFASEVKHFTPNVNMFPVICFPAISIFHTRE